MIAVTHVLDELQKQLTKAKNSSGEQEIRESLAAMQSLCGLVLGAKDADSPSSTIGTPAAASSAPSVPAVSPMEGKLLEEEDANGGSLFDF